jgi:drug/metabolite transporter (DMT)-like permease
VRVAQREDRIGLALALLMVTFGLFSAMDTIAKWLVLQGYPALQVTFTRYTAHAVFVVLVFLPRAGRAALVARRPGLQVARSLALLGSTALNFAALGFLPLTVTIAIFFASPLAVCLLSIPMLGERVGIRRLTGVAIGFAGVLVITRPWSASFHPAMLLSLGAMLCTSLYFVLTRRLAGTDHTAVTQVYGSVLPALAMCAVAPFVWTAPASALDWTLLIAIGVMGAIGHALLTVAYRYAEASRVAPAVYVQILYITALSWLVFGALPDGGTVAGTAIIVASGLFIWWRERVLAIRR